MDATENKKEITTMSTDLELPSTSQEFKIPLDKLQVDLLIPIFRNLTLKDLNAVNATCRPLHEVIVKNNLHTYHSFISHFNFLVVRERISKNSLGTGIISYIKQNDSGVHLKLFISIHFVLLGFSKYFRAIKFSHALSTIVQRD